MTREKAIEILESGSWSGYDDKEIAEAIKMAVNALADKNKLTCLECEGCGFCDTCDHKKDS